MKKILAIFLLLIYTGSAFGIAVNYHYCDGHLSGIKVLNFGGDGGCKCNPADMPNDCCKDRLVYMKGDDHKSSQVAHISVPVTYAIYIAVPGSMYLFQKIFHPEPHIDFYFVRQKSPQPLFLINNVFRI